MDNWISVTELLPSNRDPVLAFIPGQGTICAEYWGNVHMVSPSWREVNSEYFDDRYNIETLTGITHWQTLPIKSQ